MSNYFDHLLVFGASSMAYPFASLPFVMFVIFVNCWLERWRDRCDGRSVMWSCVDVSYTGVPFMIIGQQTLECRNGRERHIKRQQQHTV